MQEKNSMMGNADMLVLKLLAEKDMYGYQITEELKKRSQNVFAMKAGTLYPLLHTLETKQMVSSYDMQSGGRMRKYYSITNVGRDALAQKEESWKTFSAAIERILTEGTYGI